MTAVETDFSVKIETKANKDQDIETAEKPEKVKRPILPATGMPWKMNFWGLTFTALGLILIYKDRSERR